MAWARWAQWPLRGSPWAFKHLYCHPMITQTHPRSNGKVLEIVEMCKNSIAFGTSISQTFYPKKHTSKNGG